MRTIDIFIDYSKLPFSISFFKTRNDKYGKTVQVLLYYLLMQKGRDRIYPELGIDFKVFNDDVFVIRNEFEKLAENLRSYGYEVELVDVKTEGGVVKTSWIVMGEITPISLNIGQLDIVRR